MCDPCAQAVHRSAFRLACEETLSCAAHILSWDGGILLLLLFFSGRQVQSLREKTFIRHQYFEGAYVDGFDFHRRLPYRHATDFYKQLNNESATDLAETKQTIAKAISASEGCENANMTSDYLLLASSNAKDPISKSYRRFPLDEFELFVNKTEHLTRYIEYESDSLTFRHKKDQFIQKCFHFITPYNNRRSGCPV